MLEIMLTNRLSAIIGDSKRGAMPPPPIPPAENYLLINLGERLQYRLTLLVLVFLNFFSINFKPILSLTTAKIL